MKNIATKVMAIILPIILFASAAQGAGFALYEYSARTTAMGGATVANKAEAASLGTNPSLITQLEGVQLQTGATVVKVDASTTVNGDKSSLQKDIWTLPNFYVTHKWSDQISFGLGAFSRYGLGGTYKNHDTWTGSNLAYKVKLETFSIVPTMAVRLNEELSLAMGLEAMTIDFTQKSMFLNPANKYDIHGTGISWGGNYSFTYKPNWAEKWAVGGMYRTKIKQKLNGRVNSNGTFPAINIHDADAEGAITLPDSLTAGISFQATDNWVMEIGVVGTFWSSYDQIIIQYRDNSSIPFINPQKKYKDTYRLNFGTEYILNPNWAVRAGYVFDKSPIRSSAMDTLVPADDRHLVSIGFGYMQDRWSVDAAYTHVFVKDLEGRSVPSPVTPTGMSMKYSNGSSDMVALTFGYKF